MKKAVSRPVTSRIVPLSCRKDIPRVEANALNALGYVHHGLKVIVTADGAQAVVREGELFHIPSGVRHAVQAFPAPDGTPFAETSLDYSAADVFAMFPTADYNRSGQPRNSRKAAAARSVSLCAGRCDHLAGHFGNRYLSGVCTTRANGPVSHFFETLSQAAEASRADRVKERMRLGELSVLLRDQRDGEGF